MRSVAAILLLSACAVAQRTDGLISQMEGRRSRPPTVSELSALSNGLAADARVMGGAMGQDAYASRMRSAARTLAYLNGVRSFAGRDLGLALALAGVYQRVGYMQSAGGDARYVDRNGALLSYQNAYLILTQLANQYPDDPRIRGELVALGGQVRALGGTMPVWFTVPIGGAAAGSVAQQQGYAPQPPVAAKASVQSFDMPKMDLSKVDAAQRQTCMDGAERYAGTAASAQGALSVMDSLRMSLENRGLSLRADYIAGAARMTDRLTSARTQLEAGECSAAAETLTIAAEETRRLLKELGQ